MKDLYGEVTANVQLASSSMVYRTGLAIKNPVPAACTCLLAGIGDRDGTAFSKALEEPLLHRVVIQRAVDIDRSEAGPVQSPVCQERLRIELALCTTLKEHSWLVLPYQASVPCCHARHASKAGT